MPLLSEDSPPPGALADATARAGSFHSHRAGEMREPGTHGGHTAARGASAPTHRPERTP